MIRDNQEKEHVRELLNAQLDRLIPELLPGAVRTGSGWRAGNVNGEKGNSLSVTSTGSSAGLWTDFAADESGDVFDLIRHAHQLADFPAALNWARNWLGLPAHKGTNGKPSRKHGQPLPAHREQLPDPEPEPVDLSAFISQAQAALEAKASSEAQAAAAYLQERGLTPGRYFGVVDDSVTAPAFTSKYRKALQGRLLIVYVDEHGAPAYFNARDITGKAGDAYKYLKPQGVPATAPFNAPALETARKRGHLILTEGELDAASLLTAYGPAHPVIGCSGGTLPAGWHKRIAEAGCSVLVLADNDAAGHRKAVDLKEGITEHKGAGRVRVATLSGYKDASECLQTLGGAGLINAVEAAARAHVNDRIYITETWLADLDRRAARKHKHYTTGLDALDALLGGGYLEGLHLLGGITGGGKTSLALHIAMHNAAAGRPVIYGSYEQSRLELWARIANRITGVPQRAIKAGVYNERGQEVRVSDMLRNSEHWHELTQVAEYLKVVEGGDALSRQQGTWSVESLARAAEEAAEVHGAPPLIIVDYLQRVPVPEELRIRDVRERVGAAAGMLQTMLARDLAAPVLALSSVGRASYNPEDFSKKPLEERLRAFKEAGELEYTSYTSLLLYGLPESKQGQRMHPRYGLDGKTAVTLPRTLDLVKNREGTPGRLAALWTMRRDEWADAVNYGRDTEPL